MNTPLLLTKGEYSKDKSVAKIVPIHNEVKKVMDTNIPGNKKSKEIKALVLFNNDSIFKARKYELF